MKSFLWRLVLCAITVTASLLTVSIALAVIDTSGGWRLPFDGTKTITNGPGEEAHIGRSAEAIDYAGSFTILAPADGAVLDVLWDIDFGCVVRINHNGFYSFFAHLSLGGQPDGNCTTSPDIFVHTNDQVVQGQRIAISGQTGRGARGLHLHFEARTGAVAGNVNTGNAVPVRATPGNWWNPWYSPTPNFQHDPNRPSGGAQYPESRYQPSTLLDPNGRHLSSQQSPPNVLAAWMSDISDNLATLHFGAAPNTPNTVWATIFQVYEMLFSCGGCWQAVPGGPNTTAPTFTEAQGPGNQSDPNGQHTYLAYDYNQHDGQGNIARFWDFWTGNSAQRIPHISAIYRQGPDTTVLEYCASSAVQYVVYEDHGSGAIFTYQGPACRVQVHRNLTAPLNYYIVSAQYSDGTWSPWTIWLIVHF